MKSLVVKPVSSLKGDVILLGDKSIAHRAIILSCLSSGKTEIRNFPSNKDSLSTLLAFKKLGLKITKKAPATITIFGNGLYGLKKPSGEIYAGDSGTTLRLLLGVLAGQNFCVTLSAGKSLSSRPMLRLTAPLRLMGAHIDAKRKAQNSKPEEYPPITIKGGNLKGITYKMPVASAQVKSAILLAGLYADGKTQVIEPIPSRDHTERMLKLFRADIQVRKHMIAVKGGRELVSPGRIYIAGDISSASFFIIASLLLSGSRLTIKNVSLNPSRIGVIRVLKRMGAGIKIKKHKASRNLEPIGNLVIKGSSLGGTLVKKAEIPGLIDELPVLMVAACFAKGKTIFQGIEELRVKETDRIKSMSEGLTKMGARIKVEKNGFLENIVVRGVDKLCGAKVKTFGDHRTAMSLIVAGVAAEGQTIIDDFSCINKSFPDFLVKLSSISR